jgi:diacylglycerol kinase (ATP)
MIYKLIANPHAGRGRAKKVIRETVRCLNRRAVTFDLEYTTGPFDARNRAAAACSSGEYAAIIAIGGDGTLHEIVQGAIFSRTPIGIIPAGSGNDFSKVLNMPKRLEDVIAVLLAGRTKVIDAGRMNDQYFINGVGIGFDAAVNVNTGSIRGVKNGFAVYLLAFLKTLKQYKPRRMKVSINGESIDQELFLVSIGNGTTCGGGFRLTPHALIDDQLLDITMVRPLSVLRLLRHLPKVFLGTIDRSGYATMHRATKLSVESRHPLPLHLDGEFYTFESDLCDISVVPKALTMIGNFSE